MKTLNSQRMNLQVKNVEMQAGHKDGILVTTVIPGIILLLVPGIILLLIPVIILLLVIGLVMQIMMALHHTITNIKDMIHHTSPNSTPSHNPQYQGYDGSPSHKPQYQGK